MAEAEDKLPKLSKNLWSRGGGPVAYEMEPADRKSVTWKFFQNLLINLPGSYSPSSPMKSTSYLPRASPPASSTFTLPHRPVIAAFSSAVKCTMMSSRGAYRWSQKHQKQVCATVVCCSLYSLLLNFCSLLLLVLWSHWSRLGCVPQGWSQVSWWSARKMYVECAITCWFLRHPSFVRSSSILNTVFHSFPIFPLSSSHVILHNGIHLSHSPSPRMIHGV